MRVLLVDSSKTMRNIQRTVLAQIGCADVEEAANGQEALRKIGDFGPDLVLLDWKMPDMDGPTFLKLFRASNKSTPVIIVSAEDNSDRVVEAKKAGASDFVVKPFTPDLLQERIDAVMQRRAA